MKLVNLMYRGIKSVLPLALLGLVPSVMVGQSRWEPLSMPDIFPLEYNDSAQVKVIDSEIVIGATESARYYSYSSNLKLIRLDPELGENSLRSFEGASSYNGWEVILEDFLLKPDGTLIFGGKREHDRLIVGQLTYPDWNTPDETRTGTDVTELLQAEVDNQGGSNAWIYVNNSSMGGDPAPGQEKTLWVTYKTTSGTFAAQVRQNDYFYTSDHEHTMIDSESTASGIEIISGLYGVEDLPEYTVYELDRRLNGNVDGLWDLSVTHLAQGNGRYVASVGLPTQGDSYYGSGGYASLLHSVDAEYWTPVELPLSVEVNDLSFQNGVFVACGRFSEDPYYYYPSAEYGDGVVMFSGDGINWSVQLISTGGALNSVTWNGNDWIAAGEGGVILKWGDFFWDEIASPTVGNIEKVLSANGRLIIGTEDGNIYSSSDQVNWAHQARCGAELINLVANESHLAALSRNGVWTSEFSVAGTADIVMHPESSYTIPGAQMTLQVEVVGEAPLSYQWYEGSQGDTDSPIAGATGPEYTTPALQATASYWVRVTNSLGYDDSLSSVLRMQSVPTITDQPDNSEVEIGRSQSLRVSATGENLSYQWFHGLSGDTALPITGAVGNSLSVRPRSESDSLYWVRVTNDLGSADSRTATVSGISLPPRIRAQPVDKTVFSGTNSSISLSVDGYELTYRWYSGQTGDTSELLRSDSSSSFTVYQEAPGVYQYWMRVSNPAGQVDSRTVEYEILPGTAPVISKSPLSVSAYVGDWVNISVTSHGNGHSFYREYQWYAGISGDTSIPLNATASSFTPSTLFAGVTPYWVRVSNESGYADSETAYVGVLAKSYTTVESQPLDLVAYRNSGNSSTRFSVGMSELVEVLAYQWYEGSSGDVLLPISGATDMTYSPDLSTVGSFEYWVRVTTSAGSVDSLAATATVLPVPLRITEQPIDLYEFVDQGISRAMAVRATGENLTYQWYEGISGDVSTPLVDETGSALYSPFEEVGEREYWVRVSSGTEFLDSRTVTYGVIDAVPYISRQPENIETTTGSSSRIFVSVNNSVSRYSFQWYEGTSGDTSSPVVGANEYDLDIPPKDIGIYRYWVRVSDANDSVDSMVSTVTVQPSSYSVWAAHYGVDGVSPGESSASDGVSNLLKYAMGLNPSIAYHGSTVAEGITRIGGEHYFTIRFRLRSTLSDADVFVEATNDLADAGSWATTPVDMGPSVENGDGTITYTFRSKEPLSGRRFMRLSVEESP